jgi:hypothetical protein
MYIKLGYIYMYYNVDSVFSIEAMSIGCEN